MDIRKTRQLKTFAGERLEQAQNAKRIVLIYAGITVALSALVTAIDYCLSLQISNTVGLSSLGTRSLLSTLQTVLPLAQTLFLMCLDLGYIAAMLRIARGQYTSPQTLRLGFDRFWVLLRASLLQTLLYCAVGIAAIYLSVLLYLMTPLANSAMEILIPLATEAAAAGETAIWLNDDTYFQLMSAMTPALALCGVLYCAACAPFAYRFRMVNYILIDHPGMGAIAALRESRKMMKGNCLELFRLDLSMWWYYAALLGASIVQMLPVLGVELPVSSTVSYFIFCALFLVLEFGIYLFFRNRVEVTYALAYDSLRPEEKNDGGVVLGNIFQM